MWKGARQFDFDIDTISGARMTRRIGELASRYAKGTDRLIVWVSKGIAPLPRLVGEIRRVVPSAVVIVDLDDDDAGLARAFRARSLSNAFKLNPLRVMHPLRIEASQQRSFLLADGLTYATDALRRRLPANLPATLIPHTRAEGRERLPPAAGSDRVRIGAFGTIRAHKGQAVLQNLIATYQDVELFTFQGSGMGAPGPGQDNWTEISPDTPLEEAYDLVDVALIVMDATSDGGDVQLPAKLIDAMKAGVPIVATRTDPIDEIAGGVYLPLDQHTTLEEIHAAVMAAVTSDRGHAARERFLRELTPSALASTLIAHITQISQGKGHTHD
ncbi:hypothetical protein D9V28_12005 [Mycetocola zhadangensis]|uniref:Glycosyltransferase n=2 Tax=Mycetocola zhadangensis TaxID=1164595 RepID=A0A3L7J016_9MICO|nr:hypothetical protein D9V28_12005 [Mycetocola zhadangensis]